MSGTPRSGGRPPADAAGPRPVYRICVICSGNICRSPMGEVVLQSMLAQAGLAELVSVDSAGTGGWHEGHAADRRTVQTLSRHGYDGSAHRAREFRREWLEELDLVVVADRGHVRSIRRFAATAADRAKVRLIREFDPVAVGLGNLEVDDPYYGGPAEFERCLTEIEAACRGLVRHLAAESRPL